MTPPPPSWQRARRPEQIEARRAAILSAADVLFADAHYDDVSLCAIAERVGISKSNLYRYFESKEDIFLTLFERDVARWAVDLEGAFGRTRKALDPEGFARVWTRVLENHGRLLALNALLAGVLERNVSVDTVAEFKSRVMDSVHRARAAVRAVIPGLDERGSLELVRACHAFAAGLWPMAHPAPVMREVIERPEFRDHRIDFAREMRRAVTALAAGYWPAEGEANG